MPAVPTFTGTDASNETSGGKQVGMNPEVKTQWVAALRSGEYRQTRGQLTRVMSDGTEAHCCLGVLTELAVKAGVTERVMVDASNIVVYRDDNGCSATALPSREVCEWAGIADTDAFRVLVDGKAAFLTALNDNGMPFTEISTLIDNDL